MNVTKTQIIAKYNELEAATENTKGNASQIQKAIDEMETTFNEWLDQFKNVTCTLGSYKVTLKSGNTVYVYDLLD